MDGVDKRPISRSVSHSGGVDGCLVFPASGSGNDSRRDVLRALYNHPAVPDPDRTTWLLGSSRVAPEGAMDTWGGPVIGLRAHDLEEPLEGLHY
jgi:hypothetical protein